MGGLFKNYLGKKGNDMNRKNTDERFNASGCKDTTAYKAMRTLRKEERRKLIKKSMNLPTSTAMKL